MTAPRRVRLQAPPRRPDPLVTELDTPIQRIGLAVVILALFVGLLILAPNPTIWP